MKFVVIAAGILVLAAVVLVAVSRLTAAELKVGDEAPNFTLPGSDGKTYSLADYRGKKAVVLAWFPKAFTPGCTNECKSFRADGEDVRAYEVAYFTASCDDAETNRKFAESLGLDYPILSDADGSVARAYGVTDAVRKFPRRWTFIIGPDGKILHVDKSVNTASHAEDVAAKLKELGIPKQGKS